MKWEARITLHGPDDYAWITVPVGRFECWSDKRLRARVAEIEHAFVGSGVWIDRVTWRLRYRYVDIRVAKAKDVSTMDPWVAS